MRDSSVSISKAIAIILMVLAHSRFSEYGNYWINMFHMPLFFFLSGYCFKTKYLTDVKTYVQKKITGIWWPFVKWVLIFVILHNVFCAIGIYTDIAGYVGAKGCIIQEYSRSEYPHILFNTILLNHTEQLLGGFWFLKTLFFASLFGYGIIFISESKSISLEKLKIIVGGGILVCLTIILSYFDIRKFPYLELGSREIFATLFFISGYGYKRFKIEVSKYKWSIVAVSLVLITIGVKYWQASLLKFAWWQVIPYYITAILGTLSVFEISKSISKYKTNLLKNIGDNTLTILTWHMLSFKIVSLMIIGIYELPIEKIAEFPAIEEYARMGWFVPYTFVGITVPMLFSKVKFLR